MARTRLAAPGRSRRRLDADELFTDLEKRLEALDRMSAPPVSRDMAVAQLKKALPDPLRRIDLFDLVQRHTLQVVDAAAEHPVLGDNDAFGQAVEGYRTDTDTLLHLLAAGVFHDDGTHDALWLATTRGTPPGRYQEHFEKLRHYPALLATWTMGIAAVLAHREEFIADLLTKPVWTPPTDGRRREEPSWYLNPWNVLYGDSIHIVSHTEDGGRFIYPHSRLLNAAVREPLLAIEPDDRAFEAASVRFQFLASLVGMDTATDWRRGPCPESSSSTTGGATTATAWPPRSSRRSPPTGPSCEQAPSPATSNEPTRPSPHSPNGGPSVRSGERSQREYQGAVGGEQRNSGPRPGRSALLARATHVRL
ncbi:hypothetical protein [Streptomyces sp. NRRL S-495]|uniref:hypothetical protein n=1 Tax=Streptomyces sp. NRRL S-495 TaxID=1609133 RepID=UPI0005F8AF5F|nr:hypothetical protein [Streptomyces sp. NRRL S-495]KJY32931.1 hypothetical protein VR45_21225 [Streptomyces sp. NRRL S-495]